MNHLKFLIITSSFIVQTMHTSGMDQILHAQRLAHLATLKGTGTLPAATTVSLAENTSGSVVSAKELLLPIKTLRYNLANGKPHTSEPSNVKSGAISQHETDIINTRKQFIAEKFKEFLKSESVVPLEHIPNIAICTSGGGYRAMISTFGFLQALQEEQILDLVLYASSLSGSAWGLGCWISAKEKLPDFISNVKNNLQKNRSLLVKAIGKGMLPAITNTQDIKDLITNLMTKYVFDQEVCLTDVWGSLIINDILSHIPIYDKQNLHLTDQLSALNTGKYPFPLYTAIQANHNPAGGHYDYEWFEFSPTDIRNLESNYFMPTWAFGRYFENGESKPKAASPGLLSSDTIMLFPPELPLSSFLGVCGSAFTVNAKELIRMQKESSALNALQQQIVNTILEKLKDEHPLNISGTRLLPGIFFNPKYRPGMPVNKNKITLIDAGIDFNLPIPPILNKQRNIDIIIILDASSSYADYAPALRASQEYARAHGFHFPKINLEKTMGSDAIIFEQANSPTVIYIPFKNDCLETYCSTFNFAYTAEQFESTKKFAYDATKKAMPFIQHAIAMKHIEKSRT